MTDVKPKTREDRLKAALRENLKRRKAQARGRADAPPDAVGDPRDPAGDQSGPDGVEDGIAALPPRSRGG